MRGIKLKCDAAGCDHVESPEEYTAALVGKTCPKCGAVILTQEDYDDSLPTFEFMQALKDTGIFDLRGLDDPGVWLMVNPHKGDLNIKISKPNVAADEASTA